MNACIIYFEPGEGRNNEEDGCCSIWEEVWRSQSFCVGKFGKYCIYFSLGSQFCLKLPECVCFTRYGPRPCSFVFTLKSSIFQEENLLLN